MFLTNKDAYEVSRIIGSNTFSITKDDFIPMNSSGLTHDHMIDINNTGYLLRVPRYNQLGMKPLEYLEHQKACYDIAEFSETTPVCYGFLKPSENLPNGALVVEKIDGRHVNSSADLKAVAECLAKLALIGPNNNELIQKAAAPYATIRSVIDDVFGQYFESSNVDKEVRTIINDERQSLNYDISRQFNRKAHPVGLIGGDSHLGNYLIDKRGKAWFVDLEFMAFDVPTLDAADAVLNVTKSLVPENKFEITPEDRYGFYKSYVKDITNNTSLINTVELSERLVTMRTLGWMCYWQTDGKNDNKPNDEARRNFNELCARTLTPQGVRDVIKYPSTHKLNLMKTL